MSEDVDYPAGCQPIKLTSNNSELIKRLRTLADALHDCPPNKEYGEPNRFLKLFRHLSNSSFMDNSSSDVQIYLAICLASILRLYSPEVPTVDVLQLKEPYFFLFRVLKTVGDISTDSPMFKRYHYFVELIAVVLHPLNEMKELDEKDAFAVYRALIKSVLGIPCGKGWKKSVKNGKEKIVVEDEDEERDDSPSGDEAEEEEAITSKIIAILINIATSALNEVDFVPNNILDVLFFYITEPQRTHYPEACYMAQEIIRKTKNQIEPSIQNVLHTSVLSGELPSDFEMTGSESRAKFYDVLRALHHIGNDLVATAIPFLTRWLQAETENDRQQAVKLIGLMTKEKMCQFGLSSDDITWKAFLNSSMDESVEVRRELVKQSKNVLTSNHSQLRGPITNCLLHLFKDVEDGVRELCIVTVIEVAKIKLEAVSDKLITACNMRMKDKRSRVRLTAVKNLMSLYHHVMTSSPQIMHSMDGTSADHLITNSNYTDSDKQCVEFIPRNVLFVYRYSQKLASMDDVRLLIERYFQLYFVPYKIEPKRRIELMAVLFRSLDERSLPMFGEIVSRSSQVRRAIIGIVNDISSTAGGKIVADKSAQLRERIRRLSNISSEPNMLEKVLMAFTNQMSEDEKTFEMMKFLISDDYTTDEMESTASQLIYRTIEKKTILSNQQAQMTTFRRFVDRCAPLSMDSVSAKALLDLVANTVVGLEQKRKSAEENFSKDIKLLKVWTDNFPHLFTSDENLERVRKDILNSEEPEAVEVALDALMAMIAKSSFRLKLQSDENVKTKSFKTLISDFRDIILRNEPKFRRSAKLATRLTTLLIGKENSIENGTFDAIVDELVEKLEITNEGCANALQVLAEIYTIMPKKYHDKLWPLIESGKIGNDLISSHEVPDKDEEPIEFDPMVLIESQPWPKYTMAKVYAVKFATKLFEGVYRLLKDDPVLQKDVMEQVEIFIRQMEEIIVKKGAVDDVENSEIERARLRVVAGSSLLRLSSYPNYRMKVSADLFKEMSYLVLDDAYCVRSSYVNKVKKGIAKRLPIDFAACYGLVNLGKSDDESEEAKLEKERFKVGCLTQAAYIFGQRSESVADHLKLSGGEKTMFCSETVVAYTVWLLANYKPLRSVDDVSLLAEMQECLWLILDALKTAKCNMQKVGKVLEMIKKYGDRPMRDKISKNVDKLYEHNKKLWALSDLGTMMMMYRAKIQINDDLKESGVNRQFFYVCTDKADPSEVYAPDVLIEDEKQRNGKLPKGVRNFNVLNTSKRSKSTTSVSAANQTRRKGRGGGRGANDSRAKNANKTKNVSIFGTPDEENEEYEIEAPVRGRGRAKRGKPSVFDIPEEEEEEEEPMPPPKRSRRRLSVSNISEENEEVDETDIASPSNGSRRSGKKVVVVSPEKGKKTKMNGNDESLTNLEISPIVRENGTKAKRTETKKAAKLMSSTPMRVEDKKGLKSKTKQKENDEEEEIDEPIRRRGRSSATTVEKKEKEVENGVGRRSGKKVGSPKKKVVGEEEEEEDEEEAVEEQPKKRGRKAKEEVPVVVDTKKKKVVELPTRNSRGKKPTEDTNKKTKPAGNNVFDMPMSEDEESSKPKRKSTRSRK